MDSDSEDSVTFSTIGGNLDFDFEDDDLGLFIGLVARSPLGRLSLKLKESVETVKGLLRAEHLTSPIKRQKQRLLRRLSDQQRMLLQDKIAFVLGVSYIWVTGVIFGMCPHVMPTYYAVTVIPLIALRYVLYKKKKFHYFLADLCYFANFLLLIVLFCFPSLKVLFVAAFGLANGPVSWAIYAWRNALVFHSLDKMTSIVIHLSAPLVLYAIRWFPPPSNSWFITYPLITHNDVSKTYEIGFFHSILIPMSVYLIWQAIYCYIILDLKYENVLSAKTHATSFSWISKDFLEKKTDSIFTKVANWVGPKNHLYLFLVMNFLYALVTLLPTVLFYRYFWLHTAFIVFIINISIFNGADYYMEVFSRQYLLGVEKQMAQEKLVPVPMLQDLEIKKTS